MELDRRRKAMSNYREDTYLAKDLPARRGDDPSGGIVSFPASVQRRLDQAQALLRQDRPAEALSALQQAGAELARTAPELFALVVAAQMGMTRIMIEEQESSVHTVRTDRYALGVRYGRDETTTSDTRTKSRSISLG